MALAEIKENPIWKRFDFNALIGFNKRNGNGEKIVIWEELGGTTI